MMTHLSFCGMRAQSVNSVNPILTLTGTFQEIFSCNGGEDRHVAVPAARSWAQELPRSGCQCPSLTRVHRQQANRALADHANAVGLVVERRGLRATA